MKDFLDLFSEEYNTQRDQWENTLKAELKLEEVLSKTTKKHLDLGSWPTLSLEAKKTHQLSNSSPWKKASQSYLTLDSTSLAATLNEDLEGGVRAFFFSSENLSDADWTVIQKTLSSFSKKEELEIYLLGKKILTTQEKLKIIPEASIITAREIHEQGGHNVHELAVLTLHLIESLETSPTHVGVFLDSHFFKNIAKVRAVKLLSQKVLKEAGIKKELKVIALNSYREWTLFERYSNMLRNNVQVASGYIAGADVIQSSGYQVIFDLETDGLDAAHTERSLRMARNTSHILGMESMLGIVEDAAYGSYHLENLSHQYAEEAWKLMQVLIVKSAAERKTYLDEELKKIREIRLDRVKTRKDVLTGMNDFPDGKEHLGVTLKEAKVFRVSRIFEEARLKVEKLVKKPKVQIVLQGDYGALNGRINFIKNYFELIGLEVIDPLIKISISGDKVIVLCSADADYPELAASMAKEKSLAQYVAGKVEVPGYEAIFAGQNIYSVLASLVSKLEGVK